MRVCRRPGCTQDPKGLVVGGVARQGVPVWLGRRNPRQRSQRNAASAKGQLAIADLDPEGGLFHPDHTDVMHDGFDRKELAGILVAAGFVDIEFGDAYVLEKPIADGTLRPFTIFLVTAQG